MILDNFPNNGRWKTVRQKTDRNTQLIPLAKRDVRTSIHLCRFTLFNQTFTCKRTTGVSVPVNFTHYRAVHTRIQAKAFSTFPLVNMCVLFYCTCFWRWLLASGAFDWVTVKTYELISYSYIANIHEFWGYN